MSAEWKEWSRANLPSSRDGIDFTTIETLYRQSRAPIVEMLRLGLAARDCTAAEAIGYLKVRALLPELKDLLGAGDIGDGRLGDADRRAGFHAEVVLAANALDPATDYAVHLIPLIASPNDSVRISATMGARHFHKDTISKALLEAVRRNGDYFTRVHAADSLLSLWDIYPREASDHAELFELIRGPWRKSPRRSDFENFARGAQMLEAMMAARAAGDELPVVRPAMTHVEVHHVNANLVAVALDAAESSKGKEYTRVVFIESAAGFRDSTSWVLSKVDPTNVKLSTATFPVTVEYSRQNGTARVHGVEAAAGDNALFVAVAGDGRAAARWSGRLDIRVAHGGDLVQTLLAQSGALKDLAEGP